MSVAADPRTPRRSSGGRHRCPDDSRSEITLRTWRHRPSPAHETLAADSERVREHRAEYEYPREIEFADALPQTTSGKIRRKELQAWNADDSAGESP
ncbi:hypothetical protein C8039_07075 [Halogeometricum sp. wsp3]|nr:hypothetical protein C8039_07075 [Halogeometricum sp. wsp3]